jgi:hypothetical protein
MKNLIILMLAVGLGSCSSEPAHPNELGGPQKWELVKMTGSMINSVTTGSDMSWQEYYFLNEDGTFFKSREQNGKVQEARGTYSRTPDEQSVLLTYQSGLHLRASCLSDPSQEILNIVSSNKLVGTWNICDGPGLEYKLVEGQIID